MAFLWKAPPLFLCFFPFVFCLIFLLLWIVPCPIPTHTHSLHPKPTNTGSLYDIMFMPNAWKQIEVQITHLIVTQKTKSLLPASLKRAFNADNSICEKNKDTPMRWAFGNKENSYRKDLRKQVMKPDLTITKGRHTQNQNRERERWRGAQWGQNTGCALNLEKNHRHCLPVCLCPSCASTSDVHILP